MICQQRDQVWRNSAHFGKIFKVLGNFLRVYFLIGKLLEWLWQIFNSIGKVFNAVNGQMLKNNLATWSHCVPPKKCFKKHLFIEWVKSVKSISNHDSSRVFETVASGPHPHAHRICKTCQGHWQCDQIGRFLKVLGGKFYNKSSPNIWSLSELL